MKKLGFNYFVAERIHSSFDRPYGSKNGYGLFSARYGNVYTARQLLQLLKRAEGEFEPLEDHWHDGSIYLDPLRPTVQPGGFATLAELRRDRAYHLSRVTEMLRLLDVFIFTLGLTEAWTDDRDGTVFPVCPGVAGGVFKPEHHVFRNFSVDEVAADMRDFLLALRRINPNAKVILTVSPVPLVATAEARHVLAATTYSKSVLRVVCDIMEREFDHLYYFPSYEIISGPHGAGRYFAEDLRNVAEEGVDHVMRVFERHFLSNENEAPPQTAEGDVESRIRDAAREFVEVECDEKLLEI